VPVRPSLQVARVDSAVQVSIPPSPVRRSTAPAPAVVYSPPLVDAVPSPRGRYVDLASPLSVDAINRMRRKRSRGERTRRRERSLARLSRATRAAESPSPIEKTEYVDASGDRVTRYRTSTPKHFSQPPIIDQTPAADVDDVRSPLRLDGSRLDSTQTSLKGFVDDDDEVEKIVSSRTSTPAGRLRSMLVQPETGAIQPETDEPTGDFAETSMSKRLSYAVQPPYDAVQDEVETGVMEFPPPTQAASIVAPSPSSILPRSSVEERTLWASPLSEPVVSRTSVEAFIPPAPVTALSVPPAQHKAELQRIRQSLSLSTVAAADLPSQPSSTTSKAALLHQQQKGDAATSDVPVQPSFSKQVRRSSLLDVSDVPMQPSVIPVQPSLSKRSSLLDSVAAADVPSQPSSTTSKAALLHEKCKCDAATSDVPAQPSLTKQMRRSSLLGVSDVPLQPSVTKASRPSAAPRKISSQLLDDITKQRLRILSRPPDDGFQPMLQTPLADSEWETVYEEDLAQSSKPYPFYRTPVMASALRSTSPRAKVRRTWVRAPPGGWTQSSERRYSVPRLSPPKFVRRQVRYSD